MWFIEDWRLDDGGRIAGGFGNRMEAGMSGRIGNTVTINGRVPGRVSVRAGERVRLRVVNAALARIASLRFKGHQPIVVAYDGQPCDPHPLEDGRLLLGPAMRADLIIDMTGKPISSSISPTRPVRRAANLDPSRPQSSRLIPCRNLIWQPPSTTTSRCRAA